MVVSKLQIFNAVLYLLIYSSAMMLTLFILEGQGQACFTESIWNSQNVGLRNTSDS